MFFQAQIILKREDSNLSIDEIRDLLNLKENFSIELSINKDPKKASIGIEELKPLIEWNSKKSQNLRVGIINNSEIITTEGQNSLLKVLEEPSPNTQIILVAKNLDNLLKTIISRCHINKFEDKIEEQISHFDEFRKLDLVGRYKFIENLLGAENPQDVLGELLEETLRFLVKNHETFDKNHKDSMVKLVEESIRAIKSKINLKLVGENFISHTVNIK